MTSIISKTLTALLAEFKLTNYWPETNGDTVIPVKVVSEVTDAKEDKIKQMMLLTRFMTANERESSDNAKKTKLQLEETAQKKQERTDDRMSQKIKNWVLEPFSKPDQGAYVGGKFSFWLQRFISYADSEKVNDETKKKALNFKSGSYIAELMNEINDESGDSLSVDEIIETLKTKVTIAHDTSLAKKIFKASKRNEDEKYTEFVNRLFREANYVSWNLDKAAIAREVWAVIEGNCEDYVNLRVLVEIAQSSSNPGGAAEKKAVMQMAGSIDKTEAEKRERNHLVAKVTPTPVTAETEPEEWKKAIAEVVAKVDKLSQPVNAVNQTGIEQMNNGFGMMGKNC